MLIEQENVDNHTQNFHRGGILSDIPSKITFYGSAYVSPLLTNIWGFESTVNVSMHCSLFYISS